LAEAAMLIAKRLRRKEAQPLACGQWPTPSIPPVITAPANRASPAGNPTL